MNLVNAIKKVAKEHRNSNRITDPPTISDEDESEFVIEKSEPDYADSEDTDQDLIDLLSQYLEADGRITD